MTSRRSWWYFLPALLILLAALVARLLMDGGEPPEPVAPPTTSSSSTAPATAVPSTTTTTLEEAPLQGEGDAPLDLDLTKVDRQLPKDVAAAWGCAYWAHPRGETPEALAQRLSPLATPEMTAAVEQLRIPDYGGDAVEVYPGATERAAKPNTYSVGCRIVTVGPDGTPTAPPKEVLPEVTVGLDRTRWVVSGATVGGVVLP